jgi:hypothetical protein
MAQFYSLFKIACRAEGVAASPLKAQATSWEPGTARCLMSGVTRALLTTMGLITARKWRLLKHDAERDDEGVTDLQRIGVINHRDRNFASCGSSLSEENEISIACIPVIENIHSPAALY